MLDNTTGNSMTSQKANDPWGHVFLVVWEVRSEVAVWRALPKNFYDRLLRDIIAYTVSPANMKKKGENQLMKTEHETRMRAIPRSTCTPFLPATVSYHGLNIWISIRNSSQLSQGPWESDVCSCEQSVLTTLLMSSIMMMDARAGQGEAEQTEGGEVGVTAIKDHKLACWKRATE